MLLPASVTPPGGSRCCYGKNVSSLSRCSLTIFKCFRTTADFCFTLAAFKGNFLSAPLSPHCQVACIVVYLASKSLDNVSRPAEAIYETQHLYFLVVSAVVKMVDLGPRGMYVTTSKIFLVHSYSCKISSPAVPHFASLNSFNSHDSQVLRAPLTDE